MSQLVQFFKNDPKKYFFQLKNAMVDFIYIFEPQLFMDLSL